MGQPFSCKRPYSRSTWNAFGMSEFTFCLRMLVLSSSIYSCQELAFDLPKVWRAWWVWKSWRAPGSLNRLLLLEMTQCQQKQVCPKRVRWGHLQLVVLRAFLGGGVSARTLHASPAHSYPLWCPRASEQLGPVRGSVSCVLRCPLRWIAKVDVGVKSGLLSCGQQAP